MSRYLTPAKIGLLILIELYVDKAVPTSSMIDILSFITSHLLDSDTSVYQPSSHQPPNARHNNTSPTTPNSNWAKAAHSISLVTSTSTFEALLSSCTCATGIPGRSLWHVFLERLWKISSLHALHDFFEQRAALLAKSREDIRRETAQGVPPLDPATVLLSPNSPFGAFTRRAKLEFDRLRFEDAFKLWKEFIRYRQGTAAEFRKRNPGFQRLSFDRVLAEGEHEWGPEGTECVAAVAYGDLLGEVDGDGGMGVGMGGRAVSTDDVEKLIEFQIEQMQKYGNRVPLEIRHRFHDLVNDAYLVPSLSHYLSYLDAWRAGDYSTSFDYLHRYFDYTMQNRDRLFYQYALMNLAVLQADFGCYKEAVSAMLETVSTARENRDMTCLNFSLNWLFHFGRAHPDVTRELESNSMLGTGKESLAFLRAKAKETGMWPLWSSALVTEAKMSFSNGENIATALEHMVRSSQILVERNMKSMMGAQLSLSIALWDRLGISYLSSTTCQVFLHCHVRHSLFDDHLKVTCRQASMLALRGKYDAALSKLESLDPNSLRAWKPNMYWHKFRGIIRLRRDLHHGDLSGAELLLSQLLQSKDEDLEPDLAFVIDSLHIECLMRRGDFSAAFTKLESLIAELGAENRDIALRVRLLLLKAELLDRCGRPQRGFTIAVRAAHVAWRSRLIPYLWPAMGAIANILVSRGDFAEAERILNAVLPRSLECDNVAMTARLYGVLGDAHVGMAGQAERGSGARQEALGRAVQAMESARALFEQVEDVGRQGEMLAKKATVLKVAGDWALANDAAAAYLVVKGRG